MVHAMVGTAVRTANAFVFVLVLLAPGTASAGWSAAKSGQADILIERFLRPRSGSVEIPALSVAIGIDGELVLAKGYGAARQGSPAGARTVYHIGSLTKQFTAAAVLRLIETGARAPLSGKRLTLDTPMGDIFEGVERWSAENMPPMTVRSLLSMTSNLPNFTRQPPREADPWGAVETPKLLAALKRLPPRGWPNTFEYSNTGYFLLTHVIEASLPAGGGPRMAMREYVRSAILAPAGLDETGFVGAYPEGADIAAPHYRRRPAFAQPHWLDGSGDMASNVTDLFRWNAALMTGKVLGPESIREMFSDAARVDPLTYYGMGWFIDHEGGWDTYHHSGSVPGYTSFNAITRHVASGAWLSVTLLTNSDGVEELDRLADALFYLAREN